MNFFENIKLHISGVLVRSGVVDLFKSLSCDRYLIVIYHRVVDKNEQLGSNLRKQLIIDAGNFEKHLSYLSKYKNVKSLREVLRCIENNEILEPDTVVITFDDGYKDNYEVAYPLLKKYNLPATIFLTTGPIDQRDSLWWDKVLNVINYLWKTNNINKLRASPLGGYIKDTDGATLTALSTLVIDLIKSMERGQRRGFLDSFLSWSYSQSVPEFESLMLTWDMVKEMAENNISFECHTVNHEYLDELSLEEMLQETVPARERIREMTGQPADILACPNGNIPLDKIDALKKEFIANCTTSIGFNTKNTDLYALKRKDANYFQLDQGFHEKYFALEMSGLLDRSRQFKGWLDSRIRGLFTGK